MQGWIRIHSQTSTHPRVASTCIYVQTILKTFRVDVGTSNGGHVSVYCILTENLTMVLQKKAACLQRY